MAVPYIFENGQNADADKVNENFEYLNGQNTSLSSTTLENSINIAKLQYCNSLTDIDHDYMVVDIMTDNQGYLNSIVTDGLQISRKMYESTGTYDISGDVGSCFCCIDNGYYNIGGATTSGAGCVVRAITVCSNGCIYFNSLCLTDVTYIKYSLCLCQCARNNGQGAGINQVQMNSLIDLTWDLGNYSCCFTIATKCYGATVSSNTIIEYCKTTGNCWNVYKNSACICSSEFSNTCELPVITINCSRAYAMSYTVWDGSASNCNFIQLTNFCYEVPAGDNTTSTHCGVDLAGYYTNVTVGCETKMILVPFSYENPVQTTYLKLDNVGSGTISYNVVDLNTDCYIGTNISTNCIFDFGCALNDIRIELIQQDDAVSCIKSYALVAGEA